MPPSLYGSITLDAFRYDFAFAFSYQVTTLRQHAAITPRHADTAATDALYGYTQNGTTRSHRQNGNGERDAYATPADADAAIDAKMAEWP